MRRIQHTDLRWIPGVVVFPRGGREAFAGEGRLPASDRRPDGGSLHTPPDTRVNHGRRDEAGGVSETLTAKRDTRNEEDARSITLS